MAAADEQSHQDGPAERLGEVWLVPGEVWLFPGRGHQDGPAAKSGWFLAEVYKFAGKEGIET
eukprot:6710557-Heterocapsa_arctica.AAC.1